MMATVRSGWRWIVFVAAATAAPPNVLVILADDLGYADLGCQGAADVRSPRIDSLAAAAVDFITRHAATRAADGRPWFLFLSVVTPH